MRKPIMLLAISLAGSILAACPRFPTDQDTTREEIAVTLRNDAPSGFGPIWLVAPGEQWITVPSLSEGSSRTVRVRGFQAGQEVSFQMHVSSKPEMIIGCPYDGDSERRDRIVRFAMSWDRFWLICDNW